MGPDVEHPHGRSEPLQRPYRANPNTILRKLITGYVVSVLARLPGDCRSDLVFVSLCCARPRGRIARIPGAGETIVIQFQDSTWEVGFTSIGRHLSVLTAFW